MILIINNIIIIIIIIIIINSIILIKILIVILPQMLHSVWECAYLFVSSSSSSSSLSPSLKSSSPCHLKCCTLHGNAPTCSYLCDQSRCKLCRLRICLRILRTMLTCYSPSNPCLPYRSTTHNVPTHHVIAYICRYN